MSTTRPKVPSRFEEPAQVVGYLSAVPDALLRTLGWRSIQLKWMDGHWWYGRTATGHDWWRVRYW